MENNQPQPPRVLIADDDSEVLDTMVFALGELDSPVEVLTAEDGAQARHILENEAIDLVISDQQMPGLTGLELLDFSMEISPNPPLFILVTGHADIEMAVDAMKRGAEDFLPKNFEIPTLVARIEHALHALEIRNENRNLRQAVESHYIFEEIIGGSKKLHHCLSLAARAAEQSSPVLILGESGTGKDLLARAIHFHGPRGKKPFIAINCGAIAENLIESELFGHKKGAFTGAISNRQGCFEEARDGTIFLDEIGEMPLDLQVKLLRVLEARTIRRVGENREIPIACRVLAATNRSLLDQVQEGRFRQDLYYRLNVLSIEIPPLRERPEDIVPLAEHYLRINRDKDNTRARAFAPQTLKLLQRAPFPGNVRELFNVLERAFLLCDGEQVLPAHLPEEYQEAGGDSAAAAATDRAPVAPGTVLPASWNLKEATRAATQQLEGALIERALEETEGNYSKAASLLGISRASLYNKLEKQKKTDDAQ